LHATLGGGHEYDAPTGAIDHGTEVQLLVDVGTGLDQDLADRLAVGIGLVGHQALAQPVGCELPGFLRVANQLYTARLSSPSGMYLGLYDPCIATDLLAGFCGLLRGVYGMAYGDGQAVFSEELLTLILVKIHAFYRSSF